VAREVVEELRPRLERIEKLWDAEEAVDPKRENLAASSLDKHDEIIRRNLGIDDEEERASGGLHSCPAISLR